jgi:hypothetical protein
MGGEVPEEVEAFAREAEEDRGHRGTETSRRAAPSFSSVDIEAPGFATATAGQAEA